MWHDFDGQTTNAAPAAQKKPSRCLTGIRSMEKEIVRQIDSLKGIYEFIEAFFESNDIAEPVRYPVQFTVEELFTNMVKYNPGNMNTVLLDIDTDGDGVRVTMTDYDVDDFDVTKKRKVDTESPLEERKVGGLGLHLVRHHGGYPGLSLRGQAEPDHVYQGTWISNVRDRLR